MSKNGTIPPTMPTAPSYIAGLHRRSAGQDPSAKRRVWGLELGTVWVPYFLATNTMGITAIPSEDLGAPLRLRRDKDGAIRFSQSGRPSLQVAPAIRAEVQLVQENFVASLQAFAGHVQATDEGGYTDQVHAARKAGKPIAEAMAHDIQDALDAMVPSQPEPEAEPVSA